MYKIHSEPDGGLASDHRGFCPIDVLEVFIVYPLDQVNDRS